jgi:diaminopimelate epimerase
MHGAGNDFVIVWHNELPKSAVDNLTPFITTMCDRHLGVGADQLLMLSSVVEDGQEHFHMDTFNADGSDGGMCGNGLRCIASYLRRHQHVATDNFQVSTPSGLKPVRLESVGSAAVNMKDPSFDYASLPAIVDSEPPTLEIDGLAMNVELVSMGNPHCIVFANEDLQAKITELGPKIEHHAMFPERTNVMFANIVDKHQIDVAHWERGSGMTLACGTGACAVAAAAIRKNLAFSPVVVRMEGGDIHISWPGEGSDLWMSGPVHEVFIGEYLEKGERE